MGHLHPRYLFVDSDMWPVYPTQSAFCRSLRSPPPSLDKEGTTQGYCFQFHVSALRKRHCLLRWTKFKQYLCVMKSDGGQIGSSLICCLDVLLRTAHVVALVHGRRRPRSEDGVLSLCFLSSPTRRTDAVTVLGGP